MSGSISSFARLQRRSAEFPHVSRRSTVAECGRILATICPRAAASPTESSTASRCNASQGIEAYATFCGNWSDYYDDYTWVPLAGSHCTVLMKDRTWNSRKKFRPRFHVIVCLHDDRGKSF